MALSIAGALLAKISSAFFGYLSLLGSIILMKKFANHFWVKSATLHDLINQ